MLTGRDVDAAEAGRIGLVSRHVPDAELLDTCCRDGRADRRVLPPRRRA